METRIQNRLPSATKNSYREGEERDSREFLKVSCREPASQ